MATYQTMSWHGIPTGVKANDGTKVKRENLPLRFQAAVDAAATNTGNMDTDAYLAGWKWSEPEERPGSAEEVARTVAAELEETYTAERVKALRREVEARLGRSERKIV